MQEIHKTKKMSDYSKFVCITCRIMNACVNDPTNTECPGWSFKCCEYHFLHRIIFVVNARKMLRAQYAKSNVGNCQGPSHE